jgi:Domain of unknown function (DUF4149)
MSFLRFLMFLALVVWLGGVIFFPVVASTAFSVLPTTHLAGSVVSRSLGILHWMGIISAGVFLAASMLYARLATGSMHVFSARHVLLCLMLALTLISQFAVTPKMAALRASVGEIDSLPATDPARVRFDALHHWSTRLESGVLLLGLVVIYLTAASPNP